MRERKKKRRKMDAEGGWRGKKKGREDRHGSQSQNLE